MSQRFERDGYAVGELVLTTGSCERIAAALPDAAGAGVRNLLDDETVVRLVRDARFARAVAELVDLPLAAVKATLFDKTPHANWRVQWHQDRMVAVKSGDRRKDGVPHVHPGRAVLERMVAVRIHLDDCGPDNGPLRVIPGSHRLGILADEELAAVVARGPQSIVTVPRGAMLFMRPLLVHASSPAETASHRRVLHIELAPPDLMEWHTAIVCGR